MYFGGRMVGKTLARESADWRPSREERAKRDAWKRASRAVMLRVFYRLEDRGVSMAECAQIWDRPVGAQWYPGLLQLAMREASL